MQRQDTTKLTRRIGKNVSAMRRHLNESQEEFADAVHISRGYLSDIERGVCELSIETLANICKHTGRTSTQMLGI